MNKPKKSDNIQKDALDTFIFKVPTVILSFLSTIILIRILGVGGNGIWAILLANTNLMILVLGANVNSASQYFTTKGQLNHPKIFSFSILWFGFISLVFILLILGALSADNTIHNLIFPKSSLGIAMFYIGSFLLLYVMEYFKLMLRAIHAFKVYNRLNLVNELFQFCTFLSLLIYGWREGVTLRLELVLIAAIVVQTISSLLLFFGYLREYGWKTDFNIKTVVRPISSFALLGYITSIGHFLNKRLDIWIVEAISGIQALGLYALAGQMVHFLVTFVQPINEVMEPNLVRMSKIEAEKILKNYMKINFYILLLASSLLFLSSPWLIPLLFGQKFMGAVPALRILCIGLLGLGIRQVLTVYNKSMNRLDINAKAQWTGVIFTIILDFALIPKLGIVGAAYATLVAYFLGAAILLWDFLRTSQFGICALFIPDAADIQWLQKLYQNLPFSKFKN